MLRCKHPATAPKSILVLAACAIVLGTTGCRTAKPVVYLPYATNLGPISKIAFGSCADEDLPQRFWKAVNNENADLFLFLGDNIYADTENPRVMREKYVKLDEKPGYRTLRSKTPVMATWDDHDYGVNDGGADYPSKLMAKNEFMNFFEVPISSSMLTHDGIYHSQMLGEPDRRVQVIMLDTRYFRGPLTPCPKDHPVKPCRYVPSDDTTSTMLGEAQWAWLEQELQKEARVRILATSIQAIPAEHVWEKWENLPHERKRLFEVIRRSKAGGLVLLSGDRHLGEISMLPATDSDGVGYPLYEITSSGLNKGGRGNADELNRYRVGPGNFRGDNYGTIEIDWTAPEPTLTFQVKSAKGKPGLVQTVRLSDLAPDSP